MRQLYKVGFILIAVFFLIVGYKSSRNAEAIGYGSGDHILLAPGDTTHGLIGNYYNDDPGSSTKFDTLKMQRVDSVIQFDWGDGSPDPGVITNNDFSVRWVGLILAPKTGTYTFHTWTDDGSRLFINGQKIIDYWGSCCSDHSGSIDLEAGKLYPIIMEMHEGGGGASAKYLDWEVPDEDRSLVSSRYLYAIVPRTVSRPAFIPKPRLFEGVANVRIFEPVQGSVIHYTLDGSEPTPTSPVYHPSSTINLTETTTIKARAFKNGSYPSDIISGKYKIIPPLVSTPEFSPTEGVYPRPRNVSISTVDDSTTIYYTLDGSTPTTASAVYTDPIEVDSTIRIKAYAVKDGKSPSKVASATFTILASATDAPQFSIPEGDYGTSQKVSIESSTPGAVIHYAMNDEVLNDGSPIYSSPISIEKTTTLKAYAKSDDLRASDVTMATYVIGHDKDTVAAPEFSTPGGHYNGIIQVTLSTGTKNATIYYTTDGSDPDEKSTVFYAPILVKDSTVVKAYATNSGMEPSRAVSATYVVFGVGQDTSAISAKLPKARITVSPNPATNQVRISWDNLIYTLKGTYVTVTDSKGVVMKRVLIKGGYTYYNLNTSTYADGVYFIKIRSGNSEVLGKVIINR